MRSQADGSTTTSGTGGSTEEIPLAEVRFFHGIHFNIKYVGCMDIPCPRARSEVVAAMRRVRYEFKAQKMPKSPVDMAVSIGGIKVILLGKGNSDATWCWDEDKNLMMTYQLNEIYYVAQDARDDKIFCFITKEFGGFNYRCHVFKARKRAHNQQVIRTIARAMQIFEQVHSDELPSVTPKLSVCSEKPPTVSKHVEPTKQPTAAKSPVVRQSLANSLLSSKEMLASPGRLTRQSLQLHDHSESVNGGEGVGERVNGVVRKTSTSSNATMGPRANFLINSYLSNSHLTGQQGDVNNDQPNPLQAMANSTLNSTKTECRSNVNSSSYDSGAFSSEAEQSDDPVRKPSLFTKINYANNNGLGAGPTPMSNRPDLSPPPGGFMPSFIAVPAYIDVSQLLSAQTADQLGVLSHFNLMKEQMNRQQLESQAVVVQAEVLRQQYLAERQARQEAEKETRAVMDQSSSLMATVQQLLTSVQTLDQTIVKKGEKLTAVPSPSSKPAKLYSSRGVNSTLPSHRDPPKSGILRTRKKSFESDMSSTNRFLTITPIAEETNSLLSLNDPDANNNAVATRKSVKVEDKADLASSSSTEPSKGLNKVTSDRQKLRPGDISFLTQPAVLAKLTAKYDDGRMRNQRYDYISRPRKHSLI